MNRGFVLILVLAVLFGGAAVLMLGPNQTSAPTQGGAPAEIPVSPSADGSEPGPRPSGKPRLVILAASWQPAFCETAPNKVECRTLNDQRWDASHFALHGLWPPGEYCGISNSVERRDRNGGWQQLPPVDLPPALQKRLEQTMPGTRSQLERHEWIKHGTCYGGNQADYYADALALMDTLNASMVRTLFADNIGRELTQARIRDAFDNTFGAGAGDRVRVACETDGDRELISELTIGLYTPSGTTPDFRTAIHAANPTNGGCLQGLVDPAGNQ